MNWIIFFMFCVVALSFALGWILASWKCRREFKREVFRMEGEFIDHIDQLIEKAK